MKINTEKCKMLVAEFHMEVIFHLGKEHKTIIFLTILILIKLKNNLELQFVIEKFKYIY